MKARATLRVILILFVCKAGYSQALFDSLLQQSPILKNVALNKAGHYLQIVFSHKEDSAGQTIWKDYIYNSEKPYLYCASLVKLPVAVLCLKKLNELRIPMDAVLLTDSSRLCHRTVNVDTTSENDLPSIAHYIKKMMLVSDNEAYNRCFEFLGVDYIHEQLKALGYPEARIISRYESYCMPGDNLYTNPIRLCDQNKNMLYHQPEAFIAAKWRTALRTVKIGKAYKDINNRLVRSPKDFSYMNYMSLEDAHRFLKKLMISKGTEFGLSLEQFDFLERYMTISPVVSSAPRYSRKEFPDTYKKYLFFEKDQELANDSTFASANVVGFSYGFILDCARFKDKQSGTEFFLSAGLYVNSDGVLNDGKYEYEQIARPFLTELGRQFQRYEAARKK